MPRLLLELHREVRLRVADIGGNLGKREVSLHVFLHKVNRSLHGIRAIGTLSHLAILLNVAQRAKIVVEERHGIAQVLNAVSGIQGVKQLLKEVYSIADARVQAGVYRLRHNGILSVIFCKFALEVNPIDSPWLIVVGLIAVWHPGRKNKILVCSNFIVLTRHLISATAIDAVYKHILVDRLTTFTIVIMSLRIVADVGNIENRHQHIVFHYISHHLRQHKRALPGESALNSRHI